MAFKLHPVLAADCIQLGQFELCRVLLMNDANYPWLILVPQVDGVREVFELSDSQQLQLMDESHYVLKALNDTFKADKMNQAALGNMVPQLHIHHVVRYKNDAAWPAPVWGKVASVAYGKEDLEEMVAKVNKVLSNHQHYRAYNN
ncbi:HIT domain-containing protein [Kangiella geojedonensis]|uniref:Histidine triad (HIT) protein n=1 Tax=Kangiella geojedonensis TaxID=914150 RepID=A0A0F6RD29_9GAMM|nr:histidine triad (HIT) protein [Kangiella geojedonensis]